LPAQNNCNTDCQQESYIIMCFLSIPHTVVAPVYIVWPLLTGSCFKQVILYRLSATGTSSSDHSSQVTSIGLCVSYN